MDEMIDGSQYPRADGDRAESTVSFRNHSLLICSGFFIGRPGSMALEVIAETLDDEILPLQPQCESYVNPHEQLPLPCSTL